jgi:hypothetical protein
LPSPPNSLRSGHRASSEGYRVQRETALPG